MNKKRFIEKKKPLYFSYLGGTTLSIPSDSTGTSTRLRSGYKEGHPNNRFLCYSNQSS
jgi:hypothetical protein